MIKQHEHVFKIKDTNKIGCKVLVAAKRKRPVNSYTTTIILDIFLSGTHL